MPRSSFLSAPKLMNMGFHYTEQYSLRTRIRVLGLVNHASPEWRRWYLECHEEPALQKMRDAGYDFVEIHYIYGYGLQGEAAEIERTRQMVENAHAVGLKVTGYFQFFSVQEELFMLENPWAAQCLALDAAGKRLEYNYDRPSLCFSHPQVREYYLQGVEHGLRYCGLDGIRLDNDYYKGCYCPLCQKLFHQYLAAKYTPEEAARCFGFSDLSGLCFPRQRGGLDPAYLEMALFRQQHRQNIMRELRQRIDRIKPGAVLGGNPAVSRRVDNDGFINVYPADLAETHDLVCAENSLFPGINDKGGLRSQTEIYAFAAAAGFNAYPSHHLHGPDHRYRWPDSRECALTLAEALAWGQTPCTTWGLRFDGSGRSLYERPEFMAVTRPFAEFIHQHPDIWQGAVNIAPTAIYVNRESRLLFPEECQSSLWGLLQILLRHGIPFRFVVRDGAEALQGVETLLVPNVQMLSEQQLECFRQVPKVIFTGASGRYDLQAFERETAPESDFPDTPEAVPISSLTEPAQLPYPEQGDRLLPLLPAGLDSKQAVGATLFQVPDGRRFLHLVNYETTAARIRLAAAPRQVFAPAFAGGVLQGDELVLDTYAVLQLEDKSSSR